MNGTNLISRRKAIGTLGAGLATVAVSRGLAASEETSTNAGQTETVYVTKSHQQISPAALRASFNRGRDWPGKMDPRPDHGETSYKGSGRSRTEGADHRRRFGHGRAAAIAYAREGADVAINYFPTEEPDAQEVIQLIKEAGRKAIAIPGDLRDEKFCQKLGRAGGQ